MLHRQHHAVTDQQTLLEICSFDREYCGQDVTSYKEFKNDQFTFYAFNLSTGKSLPVTKHGTRLCIDIHDIDFSPKSQQEEVVVRMLQDIIDRPLHTAALAATHNARRPKHSLAHDFRSGLQYVLELYSDTYVAVASTKSVVPSAEEHARARLNNKQPAGSLGMHENSFIELTFSIDNKPAYSNNFAAIVPISKKNGKLAALLPFNGGLWEKHIADTSDYFIKSHIVAQSTNCDKRVSQLRTIYSDRAVMCAGRDLIMPFVNIHNGRENTVRVDPKEYMIMGQNTETYVLLYGILVSIGRSHVLMTEHSMNLEIVQNIMLAALNIFGHNANAGSPDLINMFYGILCYCMQLCQLGAQSYRKDILGEDIRKRCSLPCLSCSKKMLCRACHVGVF
jgi:hypothetical protein